MSNYVKPQSPIYNRNTDTYIYPLTTADQVIMPDGSRFTNIGVIQKNYSVVGGLEEPSNPIQNMIWVQTETTIGRVFFSNDEPNETFVDGDIWIVTGNHSGVVFNTLKVDNEYLDAVYPLSVKQYVNGAWIDKTAKSYQGGAWVEWFTYLYRANDQCINLTGGWEEVIPTTGNTKPTISWKADCIEILTTSAMSRYASVYTKNPINISDFTRLYARISNLSFAATNGRFAIGLRSTPYTGTTVTDLETAFPASIQQTTSNLNEQLLTVELDGFSGEYYIQTAIGIGNVEIIEIYLQ